MITFSSVKDLLETALKESPFNGDTLSISKIENYLNSPSMFVRTWGTPVHGIFIGCLNKPWYSEDVYATNLFLYVHPEHRGQARTMVKVMIEFERWARVMGCKQVRAGTSFTDTADVADRIHTKLGYSKLGSCFKKDL
jgi:GNAT superfamily N-acetyltransferase